MVFPYHYCPKSRASEQDSCVLGTLRARPSERWYKPRLFFSGWSQSVALIVSTLRCNAKATSLFLLKFSVIWLYRLTKSTLAWRIRFNQSCSRNDWILYTNSARWERFMTKSSQHPWYDSRNAIWAERRNGGTGRGNWSRIKGRWLDTRWPFGLCWLLKQPWKQAWESVWAGRRDGQSKRSNQSCTTCS
jgi:hypothetical protein